MGDDQGRLLEVQIARSDDARCPECGGGAYVDREHAERVCRGCGLVLGPVFPGWSPASSVPESPIPRRRLGPASPRGLFRARASLCRMGDALHVPDHVTQDAFERHRRLHREGATRGRRTEAVAAACLLAACKARGVPRSAREVAAAAGVTPRELWLVTRRLGEDAGARALPVPASRHLHRLADAAGVPPRLVAAAAQVLARDPAHAAGRRPETAAAAALVVSCRRSGEPHSLAALARAAGVTRQALYAAVRDLEARADRQAS